MLNQSQQETQLFETLRLANCSSVQCLRELSSAELAVLGPAVQNASYPGATGYGSFYFGPVVDGAFVRQRPSESFKAGLFYDVPLLVDREEYEGYGFSNMSQTSQAAQLMDAEKLFPYAGPAFFTRLYQLYPRSNYNSTFFQRQTWFGDFIINCPTYQMATRAVDTNGNRSAVFKLTFAAGTQRHGATIPFLANSDIDWAGASNRTLAEIMTSYWLSFVQTHDPNPLRRANAPFWPSYLSGSGDGSVKLTNLAVTTTTISPQADVDAGAKCDFFGNNGQVVMN